MKINKIKIENFKSIEDIEFPIKKYGDSYTTMLVGINESGKSNILEAMSYLKTPEDEFDYNVIHNQKDEKYNPIEFLFYLEFERKQTYLDELKKVIENIGFLDFEIGNIIKRVYMENGQKNFSYDISFNIKKITEGLFVKKTEKTVTNNSGQPENIEAFILSKTNDTENSFQELTKEVFEEYFSEKIKNIIKRYEPTVSLWKPSEKYLASEVNLNEFKENINSNIPLKHIFYIAGYENDEVIKSEIEKISNIQLRRHLAGVLTDKATTYIKNIWDNKIKIDIEITESGYCFVNILDDGDENKYNYHKMTARSEGFKQFMSLILSLSIEAKMKKRINNLILIDEPEIHLHPSGIRKLREELLKIGKTNYLFISTHSPFLVDRKHKERNIIIRKNKLASTEKIGIDENTNIIDDEVLREAFGIEVYKDLLNPHSILVEGASDKKILQKIFKIMDISNYSITNGHGSNIDTLASKLNDTDISILVVLDDDDDGRNYKEKIIKIDGSYSNKNVFTIRDLVGGIIDKGTIEDILDIKFIESKTSDTYKNNFPGDVYDLLLDNSKPIIEQIKIYLQQKSKTKKEIDKFLEDLKIKISNDFNPTKTSLANDLSLLKSLVEAIDEKLKQ